MPPARHTAPCFACVRFLGEFSSPKFVRNTNLWIKSSYSSAAFCLGSSQTPPSGVGSVLPPPSECFHPNALPNRPNIIINFTAKSRARNSPRTINWEGCDRCKSDGVKTRPVSLGKHRCAKNKLTKPRENTPEHNYETSIRRRIQSIRSRGPIKYRTKKLARFANLRFH